MATLSPADLIEVLFNESKGCDQLVDLLFLILLVLLGVSQ